VSSFCAVSTGLALPVLFDDGVEIFEIEVIDSLEDLRAGRRAPRHFWSTNWAVAWGAGGLGSSEILHVQAVVTSGW
jgi:hypothetical protein